MITQQQTSATKLSYESCMCKRGIILPGKTLCRLCLSGDCRRAPDARMRPAPDLKRVVREQVKTWYEEGRLPTSAVVIKNGNQVVIKYGGDSHTYYNILTATERRLQRRGNGSGVKGK